MKLVDKLPADLTATSASGEAGVFGARGAVECTLPASQLVECTTQLNGFEGDLPPYETLEIEIAVNVGFGTRAANEVSVSGGESYSCKEVASGTGKYTSSVCDTEGEGDFELQLSGKAVAAVSATQEFAVSDAPVAFGVEKYDLFASNEDGSPDRQAGSHPFGVTSTLDLNRTAAEPDQPALPKDVVLKLPPGLVGNPTAFPQCSAAEFYTLAKGYTNECPAKTALGVAIVRIRFPESLENPVATFPVPVFNLKPAVGEPARFGFLVLGKAPVVLDTSVRTGEGYGVTVSSENISQTASIFSAQVTLWGVPGDPSHDQSRGWSCSVYGIPCVPPVDEATPPPFLALPTSCTGPLQSSVEADSWAEAGKFKPPVEASTPGLKGCNRLPFSPSISVAPDGEAASPPERADRGRARPAGSDAEPQRARRVRREEHDGGASSERSARRRGVGRPGGVHRSADPTRRTHDPRLP